MSVLTDLETKLNGAVVDFQNVVAGLVTEAKTALEGAAAGPADSTAVDGDIAKVEGDESTLDADTSTLSDAEKAEEAGEGTPVNIPVTDGSNTTSTTTDPSVADNLGNSAVVTPQPETVSTSGPAVTPAGDPNITV